MCVLTTSPLTVPISSLIVNTSRRAWVGCSPVPSPALITGFRQLAAAFCTASGWGWRITSTSLYPHIVWTVSANKEIQVCMLPLLWIKAETLLSTLIIQTVLFKTQYYLRANMINSIDKYVLPNNIYLIKFALVLSNKKHSDNFGMETKPTPFWVLNRNLY